MMDVLVVVVVVVVVVEVEVVEEVVVVATLKVTHELGDEDEVVPFSNGQQVVASPRWLPFAGRC